MGLAPEGVILWRPVKVSGWRCTVVALEFAGVTPCRGGFAAVQRRQALCVRGTGVGVRGDVAPGADGFTPVRGRSFGTPTPTPIPEYAR